jgi:hypothetical protein
VQEASGYARRELRRADIWRGGRLGLLVSLMPSPDRAAAAASSRASPLGVVSLSTSDARQRRVSAAQTPAANNPPVLPPYHARHLRHATRARSPTVDLAHLPPDLPLCSPGL